MKFGNNASHDTPRENPAPKTYPARLIGIYDIGMQQDFDTTKPNKHQVVFIYDLLGKERKTDGSVFQVIETLTLSLHAKATLPNRLKVFGAPIKVKNEDWFDLPDSYSLSNMLGKDCMLEVGLNTKGNPKVKNVIQTMDGVTVPEAVSEFGFVDLDADDYLDHLYNAPKWIQNKIENQAE